MKVRASTPLQARRGDAKGQVLVLFALVLVVLLLVSALAIDYGGWLVSKRTYQNIADAASLAGAQQLTRPLNVAECGGTGSGVTKQYCARQAAWQSVKTALNLTVLDPVAQANGPGGFSAAYVEDGYSMWVASPPSDAGAAWFGNVTSGGTVYVRIEQQQTGAISRIGQNVVAWATAGRFPANFAVIGMCRPAAGDACLANDSNISINGNGTYLAVETGDLGTNAWVKTNGNGAAVGLGPDSLAYMEEFDDCWDGGQQCELVGFESGALQYSDVRSAVPLGAPIVDPGYLAPTVNNTATPAQCGGGASGPLAAAPGSATVALEDLPINLVAAIKPLTQPAIVNAVATNNDLQGFVRAAVGGAALNGINVTATNGTAAGTYNLTTAGGGPNAGRYTRANVESGTYTITATDPTGTYHQTVGSPTTVISSVSSNATVTAPQIDMPRNPVITGTVRNSVTNAVIATATITITGPGGPFTTTTNASGVYTQIITTFGTFGAYDVTASRSGFVDGTVNSGLLALDTTTTVNVNLDPAPASLTGTITDLYTTLPVPGVVVTLGTGQTATTDASGFYNIASASSGTTSVTLSGTSMVGYASSTPASGTNATLSGATVRNYTLTPQGCDSGDWDCSEPSGNHCGTVVNQNGANVTCSKFDQSNAIRPGTYDDIDISGCAWLDPRGGVTGLAAGQTAGIYHIRGSFHMSNNAYVFGDGVTLVFDQGAEIDIQNSGGFVLNYGSIYNSGTGVCDFTTQKLYNDGNTPCFRTVPVNDGMDYAYAAWTTAGESTWTSGTFPAYDDSVVDKGKDLGITFYAYGNGYGNQTRFRLNTAGMGYLFNGVLYAPNDDIDLGGGHNAQNAAGQIVGWTIKYHGGTKITQNWYGEPEDGPPFLIEPILGE